MKLSLGAQSPYTVSSTNKKIVSNRSDAPSHITSSNKQHMVRTASVSKLISLATVTAALVNTIQSLKFSPISNDCMNPLANDFVGGNKPQGMPKGDHDFLSPNGTSLEEGFCAPPTHLGGFHSGRRIALLSKDFSPSGESWTWRSCASECAKVAACEFWILPLRGKNMDCQLLADKGEYHETGMNLEGDRDPGCLDMENKVAGKLKNAYYINLAKNTQRRENIEGWLKKTSLTYHRIEAIKGDENLTCAKPIHKAKCQGVSGLAMSNIKIIDEGDHSSGATLVFEDDAIVKDVSILEASMSLVPDDWDIVRWNCWRRKNIIPASFPRINKYVFRTVYEGGCVPTQERESCKFFGGTHAMLWKNTSLAKLKDVWSQQPFKDIDDRLTTDKLNSYCIDIGNKLLSTYSPANEKSDIQVKKNGAPRVS